MRPAQQGLPFITESGGLWLLIWSEDLDLSGMKFRWT